MRRGPPAAAAPPLRWTSLIGAGLRARLAGRVRRLSDERWWARHTAGVQRAQLRRLLRAAAATEFGRAHGFGTLADEPDATLVDAYRRAVPLADWYALQKALARMREGGEPDVLWPGLVRDFAQTSGTTAGDKFIPVSREMHRSNFRAAMDIFAHAARFGVSVPRLLGGKLLFLGGSTSLEVNARGVRTGDLSGLATQLIRWPLSEIYSPGHDIALLSHWPTKIDAMAARVIDQDVRMVSGMPSWSLVLFERVLELARQRRLTSRHPARAGRPAQRLADLWPHLTLYVHGGVKYAPFAARLHEAWSGDAGDAEAFPRRLELYPASEGFVAMQDRPGEPGLRLNADIGLFFEFVPLEEVERPDARAFTPEAVERGQRYVVVLSTCAGLWRYILGDVVEFDTIPGRPGAEGGPARLRIVGRHRHFINAFGENLIVEHVENAVAAAAAGAGVVVGEFTAAPVYPGPGTRAGLELAVEFPTPPTGAALGAFRDAFDASLKAQNVDYTTKRTDGLGMAPPTITPLPMGTFHRWLQERGKLGGQHKCPRCANHRDIIGPLVALAGPARPPAAGAPHRETAVPALP